MRNGALILALAATALLSGCESTSFGGPGPSSGYGYAARPAPPGPPADSFDADAFVWSSSPGRNAVIGRVMYHAGDGGVWACAGQTVALIPRTRYSAARMRLLYGSDEAAIAPVGAVKARDAASPGVDYGRFVRTAVCDAKNGFVFDHLPDGAFFIIARARPHRGPSGDDGVVVMQHVEVRDGAGLHIILPVGS